MFLKGTGLNLDKLVLTQTKAPEVLPSCPVQAFPQPARAYSAPSKAAKFRFS
jgi:hypothetical protein